MISLGVVEFKIHIRDSSGNTGLTDIKESKFKLSYKMYLMESDNSLGAMALPWDKEFMQSFGRSL